MRKPCLIRPVGQINLQAVMDEKANVDQIVATLGLKEMTQGTLIRKLHLSQPNPTRRAIFEFGNTPFFKRDPLPSQALAPEKWHFPKRLQILFPG